MLWFNHQLIQSRERLLALDLPSLAMHMRAQAPRRSEERRQIACGDSSPEGESAGEIARYIADITAQLESMAVSGKLDFLAYLLGMARAESQTIAGGEKG
ncbi:MAG TPA: hypothetical protein VKV96_08345 [Roseiarcus sp.]|nr:hypothetical protein [Roseiarcus sp.]